MRTTATNETLGGHSRWWAAALAALGCAAAITACGSNHSSTSAASNGYAQGLKFSECMRANGVSNFPDPGPTGFHLTPGSGITESPAFNSAMNACQNYLPPSGPSPAIAESVRLEEIAWAKCMRAHGVPNLPDPGPNGIQFPVDSPVPRSPAFQHAQNGPCRKYLSH